jgi:hypothetical protein
MQALAIVENLDVFKDICPRLLAAGIGTLVNQFGFQGSREAVLATLLVR